MRQPDHAPVGKHRDEPRSTLKGVGMARKRACAAGSCFAAPWSVSTKPLSERGRRYPARPRSHVRPPKGQDAATRPDGLSAARVLSGGTGTGSFAPEHPRCGLGQRDRDRRTTMHYNRRTYRASAQFTAGGLAIRSKPRVVSAIDSTRNRATTSISGKDVAA